MLDILYQLLEHVLVPTWAALGLPKIHQQGGTNTDFRKQPRVNEAGSATVQDASLPYLPSPYLDRKCMQIGLFLLMESPESGGGVL